MLLTPDQERSLQQLLTAELDSAREIKALLDQEFQALKGQEHEQIRSISDDKQALVARMQQYQHARDRLLIQLGLPRGNAGTTQLLEQNGQSGCAPLWDQLMEVGEQLRDQNEINGGIIFMHQRHAKQALEILSGSVSDKNTYSRKGESMNGSLAKTLGKV